MIQNITMTKAAQEYNPQLKRIKQQPRYRIRKLLRSFEPLPQSKSGAKADK